LDDALDEAIFGVVKTQKNRPEFVESAEQSEAEMIGAVGRALMRS
jgi:hypothetical protein